jgi:hypothetical protein
VLEHEQRTSTARHHAQGLVGGVEDKRPNHRRQISPRSADTIRATPRHRRPTGLPIRRPRTP